MRYRLTIEYDGAGFCGWQAQADGDAVQDALSDAVEKFCGARVTVYGAGRTDSGVHARGQVAHLDLEQEVRPDKLRDAMNFHLRPLPVAVTQAAYARADFDARFSAIARHYRYRLVSRRAPLALDAGQSWWVPQELDVAAMQAAAPVFLGQHDFTTFRASQCQAKSPIRTLDALIVRAVTDMADAGADGVIEIRASARSFLHNQVRSLVGALKYVGEGKWSKDDCAAALAACDRTACAPVAPACGLTFMSVDYPEAVLAAPAQAAK
jgi:tRNA pseudouridine38-40 synthase